MKKFTSNVVLFSLVLLIISCKSVNNIKTNNNYVYGTDYTEIELQIKAVIEFLKIHHRDDCIEECRFSIFYEFNFWNDCYEVWNEGQGQFVEEFKAKKNIKLSTNGVRLYELNNGLKVLFGADNRNLKSFDYQFSPLLFYPEGRQLSMLVRKGTRQSEVIRPDNYRVSFHLLGRNEIYISAVTGYNDNCNSY